MILGSFRRSRSVRSRFARVIALVLGIWTFLEALQIRLALSSAELASSAAAEVQLEAYSKGHEQKEKPRLFVASTHWNNEAILRSHWNDAVVDLVKQLGPENVYVSVYESGSWDDSKGALRQLDAELENLGVNRTIALDPKTHLDEINGASVGPGWIETPRGRKELRRIPFLSRQRNLSLKPLESQSANAFSHILFLNDVVFTTQDVMRLLATNDGEYAAACALDFAHPPAYYDTFALRDLDGDPPLMQRWPYFRSHTSRSAVESGQLVPVQSCWNGVVLMDASPFYDPDSALRFRGVSDSLAKHHLEGSECCLIHADNRLSQSKGVWLNPNVRVGYSKNAYDGVHSSEEAQSGRPWVSLLRIVGGIWENRFRRWTSTTWFTRRTVTSRLQSWIEEQDHENVRQEEAGQHCLINEMQVLAANGWAHV